MDTNYSGTAAAAREAAIQGVPALASSCWGKEFRDADYLAELTVRCAEALFARPLPEGIFLNLNLPNVQRGKMCIRDRTFTKESRGLLRGEYGRLPAPVNEDVRKKAIGDQEVITCRPADLLEPEIEKYRQECRQYAKSDEDVLSYALFPQVAEKFFQYRQARDNGIDSTVLDGATHPV